MNNRNIAFRELKSFSELYNGYSVGEVLYSILRLDTGGHLKTIKDLKNLTDDKFYELICKAKIEESEEAV